VLQAQAAHPEEKLMPHFIELHLQADGDPVLVNTSRIVSALAHVSGGTLINLDGTNLMYITVRETYQDIIEVLYSRDMT
jgi:hypothetical protein